MSAYKVVFDYITSRWVSGWGKDKSCKQGESI